MELSQSLRLRQSQKLVMTPQLQQVIKLLQLPTMELVALVRQELEANPVLEETVEQTPPEERKREEEQAAAAEEKKPREKTVARRPLTARLTLGKDKEGKSYGKDNNPKRGKAAERFAKYATGQTVAQYAAAIRNRAKALRDVKWDSSQGWIRLK